MKRKISLALALAAALVSAPALAAGSPLVGKWKTVAATEMGQFEATMTVTEAGGGYAVEIAETMPDPNGGPGTPLPSTVSDVKVDGATFSFKRSLNFQGQAAVLSYTGTVEGDKLTATATSEFGSSQVTGTRL